MDRRIYWTTMSLAIAAMLFNCQASNAQYAVGTNSGCCGDGASFNYPGSAGCGSGCRSGHGGHLRAHIDHLAEVNKRAYDRNRAWPKPFDCADRQLYFATWSPMLDKGYRCNCVFTETHFTSDNQLNDAGKAKISGIFRNNPVGQKVALVQNSAAGNVVDARLRNLQSTIDQYYGNGSFQEVAVTDNFPTGFNAAKAHVIERLANEATPPPIIQVSSGTGSTSDVNIGD